MAPIKDITSVMHKLDPVMLNCCTPLTRVCAKCNKGMCVHNHCAWSCKTCNADKLCPHGKLKGCCKKRRLFSKPKLPPIISVGKTLISRAEEVKLDKLARSLWTQ